MFSVVFKIILIISILINFSFLYADENLTKKQFTNIDLRLMIMEMNTKQSLMQKDIDKLTTYYEDGIFKEVAIAQTRLTNLLSFAAILLSALGFLAYYKLQNSIQKEVRLATINNHKEYIERENIKFQSKIINENNLKNDIDRHFRDYMHTRYHYAIEDGNFDIAVDLFREYTLIFSFILNLYSNDPERFRVGIGSLSEYRDIFNFISIKKYIQHRYDNAALEVDLPIINAIKEFVPNIESDKSSIV